MSTSALVDNGAWGDVDGEANEQLANRPKFKFLRKGEGTQKRIYASKFRKARTITESHSAKVDLQNCTAEDGAGQIPAQHERSLKHDTRQNGTRRPMSNGRHQQQADCEGVDAVGGRYRSGSDASSQDARRELAATSGRSSHLNVVNMSASYTRSPALFETDSELEEFKRLERKIRREVGESTGSLCSQRSQDDQPASAACDIDVPQHATLHQTVWPTSARDQLWNKSTCALSTATQQRSASMSHPDSGAPADTQKAELLAWEQTQQPLSRLYHAHQDETDPVEESSSHASVEQRGYASSHRAKRVTWAGDDLDANNRLDSPQDGPLAEAAVVDTRHANPYIQSLLSHTVGHARPQADAYAAHDLARYQSQPAPSSPQPPGGPSIQYAAAQHHSGAAPLDLSAVEGKMAELQQEMEQLRMEREHVASVRLHLEQATRALQAEREAFDAQQENVRAAQEAEREREGERLRRERAALERERKALLKLPTRKERSEIEAMEAVVEQGRKDMKAKEARHKLTVERLRRQIVTLQEQNSQLRDEVAWNGKEVEHLKAEAKKKAKKASRALSHAAVQCDPTSIPAPPPPPGAVRQRPASSSSAWEISGAASHSVTARCARGSTAPSKHAPAPPALGFADSGVAIGVPVYSHAGPWAGSDGHGEPAPGSAPPQRSATAGSGTQRRRIVVEHGGTQALSRATAATGSNASVSAAWSGKVVSSARRSPEWSSDASQDATSALVDRQLSEPEEAWGGVPSAGAGAVRAHPATPAAPAEESWRSFSQRSMGNNENVSADFNADFNPGQLAEIAAIQAELSASRSHGAPRQPDTFDGPFNVKQAATGRGRAEPTITVQSGDVQKAPSWTRAQPALPSQQADAPRTRSQAASAQDWDEPASAGCNEVLSSTGGHSALVPGVDADGCRKRIEHADGKVERWFVDGRREVRFANGTCKLVLPSGLTMVRFVNGDAKKNLPSGAVEYYYREVDTWHSTLPSGVEVFYFPNGQTEAHGTDGSKEIIFPDGILRKVLPDGSEQDMDACDLSEAVLMPKPQFIGSFV